MGLNPLKSVAVLRQAQDERTLFLDRLNAQNPLMLSLSKHGRELAN